MVRHKLLVLLPLLAAALLAAAVSPGAGAQVGEGSTTTTTPGSPTTDPAPTTTIPGRPTTTTTPSPTTTTAPVTTLPPALVDDPRAPFLIDPGPGDGVDVPIAQHSFDPLSVAVRPELVAAARAAVEAATATLNEAQRSVGEQAAHVADLTARLARVESDSRGAISAVAEARTDLLDHAVTAYMVGDVDERLALVNTDDFVDMGVARSYVDVVVGQNEQKVRRYETLRRGLGRDHAQLADDLAESSVELEQRSAASRDAFAVLVEHVQELQAYEAGAQAYIDGFVFPVAGDVEFIDSWGFPRMTGTASEHWHQGTDIFATHGTPLIASENGVLARIGVGSLGGNKLWVVGESGTEYYYAHLSGFAPGIADGQRVRAGEVVGYVGDTGNARGTSPHLHFEIHPGGIGPVNPYPILKAAYGNRPMVKATAPPPTTAPPTTAPAGATAASGG